MLAAISLMKGPLCLSERYLPAESSGSFSGRKDNSYLLLSCEMHIANKIAIEFNHRATILSDIFEQSTFGHHKVVILAYGKSLNDFLFPQW